MLYQCTPKDIVRFWSKVDKNGPIPAHRPELGPCWVWTRGTNKAGYGIFSLRDTPQAAHRVSYELTLGEIPDATLVCHHCDNPRCVNPAHFFLGTNKDNMQDKARKGRCNAPSGERHSSRTRPDRVPRGGRHHGAILTESDVRAIRVRYAEGGITQDELAARYGVKRPTISYVISGKLWHHVE